MKLGVVVAQWVNLPCLMPRSAGAMAANYPFCTIEPNTGVVPRPMSG